MNKKRLRKTLIERYLENKASEEELIAFFEEAKHESFIRLIDKYQTSSHRKNIIKMDMVRWIAACLLLTASLWLGYQYVSSRQNELDSNSFNAYLPAKEQAFIWVDGKATQLLSDSLQVHQTLKDLMTSTDSIREIKIVTKAAQTFKLTLPDGTKAFLNSETELKFPSVFSGGIRQIEVKGEAYFEVQSDSIHPFQIASEQIVHGKNRTVNVKVVGTKFLISNYTDHPNALLALLHGKVIVNQKALKPDQLYSLNEHSEKISHSDNIQKYIDWVDNVFEFEGESLQQILQKIEKWYDVKFIYEHIDTKQTFAGVISRSVPLKDILQMLEENSILKFKNQSNNQILIHQ